MKGMNRTKVKQQYDKLTSILQNLVNTCNNYLTLLHGPFPPFPAPKGICFVLKLSRKFSLVVHQHQMAASHAHHCLKAICLQSYRCHRFFPWETVSTLERHNTRKKKLKIVIVLNILNGQKKLSHSDFAKSCQLQFAHQMCCLLIQVIASLRNPTPELADPSALRRSRRRTIHGYNDRRRPRNHCRRESSTGSIWRKIGHQSLRPHKSWADSPGWWEGCSS